MTDHRLIRFTLFFFLLFFSAGTLYAIEQPPPKEPIHFESDELEYSQTSQIIVATGSVTVHQTSYTFHSDHAIFNVQDKSLKAWGRVRFQDLQGDQIRAKFLTYNAQDESAQLEDAEGSFGPWIFAAKKISRDSQGGFALERARLSTCETDFSKYHLYGYRIQVIPNKRLTVQHALFRIGPVPVLYLPYYYYSLGEKHLAVQLYPGHSQSLGPFLRSTLGYAVTDQTYAKVYLDWMNKKGMGTGGEFNYYFDNGVKGSFYGYQMDDRHYEFNNGIADTTEERRRWNVRWFHWQKFSDAILWQANCNRMSDESFPNDFFREDFDRVARDLKTSTAFTYQKKQNYLRMIAETQDRFDTIGQNFYTAEASVPQVEYTHTQSPLGFLKLEHIYSLSFVNRYAGQTALGGILSRDYRNEANAQYSLLRPFRLTKQTQFVPKFTVKNEWMDRPQGGEPQEPWVQHLISEAALRQRMGTMLNMDLGYRLDQRLQDNQGNDRGRADHRLTFFSWFIPQSWISFRFNTAYRLPKSTDHAVAFLAPANYDPLQGEISINPSSRLEIFFREQYLLQDPNTGSARPITTQSEIVWGRKMEGKSYISMGGSYFAAKDHSVQFYNSARFAPSEKLQLEGTLRYLVSYRNLNLLEVEKVDFMEKELNAKTEWRCWVFAFTFRERRGGVEFLANVELKIQSMERSKRAHTEQSSEFYPWRQ
jgi:lipopolysaccharide export system protein LptA